MCSRKGVTSKSVAVGLSRADPQGAFEGQDEYLAVANLASARRCRNGLDRLQHRGRSGRRLRS